MMSDIDFVVTWVDGNDPEWRKDRANYLGEYDIDEARYRDWGLLKYWFRAIEMNAPWVRKIHFVTYGHIPKWLNITNPKIHIVKHSDFIDEDYLPTFSSCAIEMNLHKIPGLSEKFVYFNDDTFLNKRIRPTFFFKNNLPKDSFILKPIYPIDLDACRIQNSCMCVINGHFSNASINRQKLFSPLYGKFLLTNIIQSKYPYIVGINSKHLPQGYTRAIFRDVWDKEGKKLQEVCSHRTRKQEDCSQWLFQYWQLASGKFVPNRFSNKGVYHISTPEDEEIAAKDIIKRKSPLICINDNEKTVTLNKIIESFNYRYPEKSSYEK